MYRIETRKSVNTFTELKQRNQLIHVQNWNKEISWFMYRIETRKLAEFFSKLAQGNQLIQVQNWNKEISWFMRIETRKSADLFLQNWHKEINWFRYRIETRKSADSCTELKQGNQLIHVQNWNKEISRFFYKIGTRESADSCTELKQGNQGTMFCLFFYLCRNLYIHSISKHRVTHKGCDFSDDLTLLKSSESEDVSYLSNLWPLSK